MSYTYLCINICFNCFFAGAVYLCAHIYFVFTLILRTDRRGEPVYRKVRVTFDVDEIVRIGNAKYLIVGIVEHEGGLNRGHYWTLIRKEVAKQSKWCTYNDEHVSTAAFTKTGGLAYILLFRRMDGSSTTLPKAKCTEVEAVRKSSRNSSRNQS